MRLPRDIKGRKLGEKLERYGYRVDRQKGSHIRLCADFPEGRKCITIPDHSPLKLGTLSSILRVVSHQINKPKKEIIQEIF